MWRSPRRDREAYLDAACRHDIDAVFALWEPGGLEEFPPFARSLRVPEEFASHFRSLFEAILVLDRQARG